MPPLIQKPEDRCPYPVGTEVIYWHWPESLPGHDSFAVAGAAVPTYQGVVDIVNGETVIRFAEDQAPGPIPYEAFLRAPVAPHEPQRWYAVGVDPNREIAPAS